jgi:hypothetical protein
MMLVAAYAMIDRTTMARETTADGVGEYFRAECMMASVLIQRLVS